MKISKHPDAVKGSDRHENWKKNWTKVTKAFQKEIQVPREQNQEQNILLKLYSSILKRHIL
jgi:hypothetical protein